MSALRVFFARVKGLFSRDPGDARLSEELQAHLDFLADEYMQRGMSAADASAAARRAFGGVDQVKEVYRDQRGLPVVENLTRDLRYGLRLLGRERGFTAAAVLSLAIGIGANTAIFGLVNLSLFKEIPVPDPDTLVMVTGS